MGEIQDLCFALERGLYDPQVGQDPRVPSNICEVTPTSAIDCVVVRNLCLPESRAAQLCAAGGAREVQPHVGQQAVEGGARQIEGSIAYYPCPDPKAYMQLLAIQHGCCPPEFTSSRGSCACAQPPAHHHHGGCCG